MPAFAVDGEAEGIGVRIIDSGDNGNMSSRKFVEDVQRYSNIRSGKTCEQAVFDHSCGPTNGLLRGLADQHQCAVPGLLRSSHDCGGAIERRHVDVVAACVHHGNVNTGIILGANFAGVRKGGFLLDRKRV